MSNKPAKIRCRAKLLRPAEPGRGGSWNFLILPKNTSARLPARGMTTVEGTINGAPFLATLQPDGQKSHWLKVDRKLAKAEGEGRVDGYHASCAPGLDSMDCLGEAVGDSHASHRKRLFHACQREATRLLLRSVRNLQRESERTKSGGPGLNG